MQTLILFVLREDPAPQPHCMRHKQSSHWDPNLRIRWCDCTPPKYINSSLACQFIIHLKRNFYWNINARAYTACEICIKLWPLQLSAVALTAVAAVSARQQYGHLRALPDSVMPRKCCCCLEINQFNLKKTQFNYRHSKAKSCNC